MDDSPRDFTMIGLHKLAAGRDDGLIPELLALYAAQARLAENDELKLDLPAKSLEGPAVKSAGNDNVIQFRPYLLAKRRR